MHIHITNVTISTDYFLNVFTVLDVCVHSNIQMYPLYLLKPLIGAWKKTDGLLNEIN